MPETDFISEAMSKARNYDATGDDQAKAHVEQEDPTTAADLKPETVVLPVFLWNEEDQARFRAIRAYLLNQPSPSDGWTGAAAAFIVNAEIAGREALDKAKAQSAADLQTLQANFDAGIGELVRNLEQRITQQGELHAGQAAGWAEEAAELQKKIEAAGLAMDEKQKIIDRLLDEAAEQRNTSRAKDATISAAKDKLDQLRKEVTSLRDELMQTTVTLARHAGYIDRVKATDKKPQKKRGKVGAVLDELARRERKPYQLHMGDDYGSRAVTKEQEPWYRRGTDL